MAEKNTPKPVPAKQHRIFRALGLELDEFISLDEMKEYFFLFNERTFLPNGDLLTEKEYDDSGTILQETRNTYNENGKLTQHQLFSDGMLAESIYYTYTDKGLLQDERHEFEEGMPVISRYIYDEKDRIVEVVSEDGEGELNERQTYVYSEEFPESVVLQIKYNEDNEPEIEEKSEYTEVTDEQGKKTVLLTQRIHTNHLTGHVRKIDYFESGTHDDNIISITYNEKDKVVEIERVVLNEEGLEIEHHTESVNASDNLQVYNEHDEHARIIKQEQRQKDKILVKIERRFNAEHHVEILSYRSASRGVYLDVAQFDYYTENA